MASSKKWLLLTMRRVTLTTGLTLLIPEKPDPERERVAEAFSAGGGRVQRLGRFWDPPSFDVASVRVYGPDSFCLVLQQRLGFHLMSPDDDLLLKVPEPFLGRKVRRQSLRDVDCISFPAFIKPVVPKQFRAAVYSTADILASECEGLKRATAVLVSEPVKFEAEVRCFVLDGAVLDGGIYEGTAKVADALRAVEALVRVMPLPRAVVVDIGLLDGRSWVVVEFNAAWGAGLNGCSAAKVLPAIVAASAPNNATG